MTPDQMFSVTILTIILIGVVAVWVSAWRDYHSPLSVARRTQERKREARIIYYLTLGFEPYDAECRAREDMKRDAEAARQTGGNP